MNSRTISELLSDLSPQEIAILEQRARDLARHSATDVVEAAVPVLSFQLAGETYAIDVEYLREVRPLKHLTRVPFAPKYIVGVVNLRGAILPLIDIRKILGSESQRLADMMVMLVVEHDGVEVGILAQKVHEITLLKTIGLASLPATLSGIETELIKGLSPDGTIFLNTQQVLSDLHNNVIEHSF
jgi:purine-binding chemotaxis protein CheW